MTRSFTKIVEEIAREWPKMSPYAKPYFDAMRSMNSVDDNYFNDSGKSIVLYFLSNAASWRGEAARRIKAELNQLVK